MNAHQLGIVGVAVLLVATVAAGADESSSNGPIAIILPASEVPDANESSFNESISISIAGDPLHVILKRLYAEYGYTAAYSPGDLIQRPGPHMYIEPTPAPQAFERLAAAYGFCAIVEEQPIVDHAMFVAILPCDAVERYRHALRHSPKVEHPKVRLGIVTKDGNAAGASGTGARGAVVRKFFLEQAPAFAAGIRIGDVIVSYGGEPVSGAQALVKLVGASQPGDAVPIVVVRGARQLTFAVQFPPSSE
jgi:membrane-associated protease RseP (regulator of RpoE activity)